jgi:antitoxin YefM
MEAVSYTKARNQLSGLMEQVCQDHDPVIITRQKKPSVVVMSLEVYSVFIIIRTSGPR